MDNPKNKIRAAVITAVCVCLLTLFVLLCTGHLPAWLGFNTIDIPHDAGGFDPVAEFPLIRNFAGGEGVKLNRIEARYVNSDGLISLKTSYPADFESGEKPFLVYEFYKIIKTNENSILGKTMLAFRVKIITVSLTKPWHYLYAGWKRASLSRGIYKEEYETGYAENEFPYKECEPPALSLKGVWGMIREKHDISNDFLAQIRYDDDGYYFQVEKEFVKAGASADSFALRMEIDEKEGRTNYIIR